MDSETAGVAEEGTMSLKDLIWTYVLPPGKLSAREAESYARPQFEWHLRMWKTERRLYRGRPHRECETCRCNEPGAVESRKARTAPRHKPKMPRFMD
jgi:hypothetical protein